MTGYCPIVAVLAYLIHKHLIHKPLAGVVLQVFRRIEVKGFDDSLFQITQVFYPSKDGTKVPMYVLHRKVLANEYMLL